MATHSILAWTIPWTYEEPGGLQSMGSQRVGDSVHDWVTFISLYSLPPFSLFLSFLPFPPVLFRGIYHAKSRLIGKDSDAGRDWGQEEKGTTEDEIAGWHSWLNGRESEWTPGVGDRQGSLACCNSWGPKSWTQLSDWTELNWTELSKAYDFRLTH